MRLLYSAVVVLALYGSGCPSPAGPRLHSIYGVIRYTDGHPVNRAKVWTDTGATTFSDAQGRYLIVTPSNGDSLTLLARDGHTPGLLYGETHWGSIRLESHALVIRQDVSLDHSEPI